MPFFELTGYNKSKYTLLGALHICGQQVPGVCVDPNIHGCSRPTASEVGKARGRLVQCTSAPNETPWLPGKSCEHHHPEESARQKSGGCKHRLHSCRSWPQAALFSPLTEGSTCRCGGCVLPADGQLCGWLKHGATSSPVKGKQKTGRLQWLQQLSPLLTHQCPLPS